MAVIGVTDIVVESVHLQSLSHPEFVMHTHLPTDMALLQVTDMAMETPTDMAVLVWGSALRASVCMSANLIWAR